MVIEAKDRLLDENTPLKMLTHFLPLSRGEFCCQSQSQLAKQQITNKFQYLRSKSQILRRTFWLFEIEHCDLFGISDLEIGIY